MAFWHPFADMAAVSQNELVIERGEGVWVYDTHGTRYYDATASLWYANIGHGRAEVADAVASPAAHARGVPHVRGHGQPPGERALRAAWRELAPMRRTRRSS